MDDPALDPTAGRVRLPKFRNDQAAALVRIGAREFNCIGVSPPDDHPHVYLNMGAADELMCPYCGTHYRYDPRLAPGDAEPRASVFHEDVDDQV